MRPSPELPLPALRGVGPSALQVRDAVIPLALLGVVAAVGGLWMVAAYEVPAPMQGPLLRVVRWAVGLGMLGATLAGVRAILRRDVAAHEAWMLRAYALGQGAGTQAVLLGPWLVLSGPVLGLTRDVLLSVAWALNLLLVEWLLRRRRLARA